jgi:mycoredoxin
VGANGDRLSNKARRLGKVRRGLLFVALSLALALFAIDRYAAFAHIPGTDSKAVVIYTTVWCPYCKRLREDLQASGVAYTEYDVEKSLQGAVGFWALRGRGVPVSAIGPEVVYGYNLAEIVPALTSLGHTYMPASSDSQGSESPSTPTSSRLSN